MMTDPLNVSSLQVEAQADPEAWRPVVEPGARVLVVLGEPDLVGTVVVVDAGPWPMGLAVHKPDGSMGRATAWAPVGSQDGGGAQPDEGDRLFVLDRVCVARKPGSRIGIVTSAVDGDVWVLVGPTTDGLPVSQCFTEWAILPPSPAEVDGPDPTGDLVGFEEIEDATPPDLRTRIAQESERARQRGDVLPDYARPVIPRTEKSGEAFTAEETSRPITDRMVGRAASALWDKLPSDDTGEWTVGQLHGAVRAALEAAALTNSVIVAMAYESGMREAQAEVLGLAPGETVEPAGGIDGDSADFVEVRRVVGPFGIVSPRSALYRVIPAGGSGDGGERDG